MSFIRALIARKPVAGPSEETETIHEEDEFDPVEWLEDELENQFEEYGSDVVAEPEECTDEPEECADDTQTYFDEPEECDDNLAPVETEMPVEPSMDTEIDNDNADLESVHETNMQEKASDPEKVKIWEMMNGDSDDDPQVNEAEVAEPTDQELAREAMNSLVADENISEMPPRRTGREKTRVLGFAGSEVSGPDVFSRSDELARKAPGQYPLGWLVVVEGPGRGASFTLQYEVSSIGRGNDQKVRLNFGDNSISRNNHAAIAFDEDLVKFFIGQGGKSNLVRLNGRPVLMTEEISDGDLIRIGETTLRFVAFCCVEFAWDFTDEPEELHAKTG